MASRLGIMLVFVIPVVVSVAFASAVMAQMGQDPTRGSEGASKYISIVGIESTYSAPASIEAYVHVTHDHFDCGDLYVEIRQEGVAAPVVQEGFFGQCFASTNTMIPIGGAFSATVQNAGMYELAVTIHDAHKKDTASTSEVFVVN